MMMMMMMMMMKLQHSIQRVHQQFK